MQLQLNYPSNLLSIASESDCAPGSDWPANSLTFVCNARGNANSVLMNSILQPPFASQQGTNISVANVTFLANSVSTVTTGAISVDILGMAQTAGGSTVSNVAAIAAAGIVSCWLCVCICLVYVSKALHMPMQGTFAKDKYAHICFCKKPSHQSCA